MEHMDIEISGAVPASSSFSQAALAAPMAAPSSAPADSSSSSSSSSFSIDASTRTARLAALDRLAEERKYFAGAGGRDTAPSDDPMQDDDFSYQKAVDGIEADCFTDGSYRSSLDTPLPASNKGYQLLMKMGWKGHGRGVGRYEQGIAEPIGRADFETAGTRLGLGKVSEVARMQNEATAQRKKMELEAQLDETIEQRLARESQAARASEIASAVTQNLISLRCEDCNKQYALATELEAHRSSYDHLHTVRLRETKRAEQLRKAAIETALAGGLTKEEKRAAKEEERIQAQMKAAMDAMAKQQTLNLPTPAPASTTTISSTAAGTNVSATTADIPASASVPTAASAAPLAAPAGPISFSMSMGPKPGGAMNAAKGFSLVKKPILVASKPKFNFSAE